jgi:hypothetical protein
LPWRRGAEDLLIDEATQLSLIMSSSTPRSTIQWRVGGEKGSGPGGADEEQTVDHDIVAFDGSLFIDRWRLRHGMNFIMDSVSNWTDDRRGVHKVYLPSVKCKTFFSKRRTYDVRRRYYYVMQIASDQYYQTYLISILIFWHFKTSEP